MPTYQYSCTECGHFLEAVQSFSDDALTVCPECQGRLRKVFNAVGVVFKGSGFYRTDSRASKDSAGSNGSGQKSEGSADSSKSESKSESKSDSKSDAKSGGGSSSNGANGSPSSSKAGAGAS